MSWIRSLNSPVGITTTILKKIDDSDQRTAYHEVVKRQANRWQRCPAICGCEKLFLVSVPETLYVKTSAGRIAYQVVGTGPPDVLAIRPGFVTVELMWSAAQLTTRCPQSEASCRLEART